MTDTTWKWKLNDRRTQDRYAEKGLVDRAQLANKIKALPDEAANATWVEIDMEDGQLMDDDTSDASTAGSDTNP